MHTVMLLAVGLVAQDSGAFIVTLGRDTTAVERFVRTADRLEGDLLTRNPAVTVRHYVVTLGRDGSVLRAEGTTRPANAPAPTVVQTTTFMGDSAIVQVRRGDSTQTVRLVAPAPGAPYLNNSYALYELALRRAAPAAGGQPARVSLLSLAAPQVTAATVTRQGTDSVMVLVPPQRAPYRLRVDAAGRVVGATGAGTTQQVTVTRVGAVDIAAFAGRPLGVLSPPDSVRAVVGGAAVAIKYGRPTMRGRAIFGAVVPWDRVWRTGANFATNLTTSTDLVIGGATIPAGSYTLWTLPSPSGWKLIVNKQTKAPCADAASCASAQRAALWGTDYAADSDLVRVDLKVETLAQPVEQFIMGLDAQGDRGVLWMTWEKTKASVAVGGANK